MTKDELAKRLEAHGQTHVLRWWEDLSDEQRRALAEQVQAIDLDWIEEQMRRGPLNPSEEFLSRFKPASAVRPGRGAEDEDARAAGEQLLREGRVGLVLVAGGQGTRLRFPHPKGMFPILPLSGKTLFQLHAEKILALRRRYKAALPLYIMTSDATDAETRRYFQANDYLGLGEDGVRFFKQDSLPVVGRDGKLLLSSKHQLAMSPNGHGGAIAALQKSGALDHMRRLGLTDVFYFQVDNVLVQIADPLFMGYHALQQADMSLKVLEKRDPEEGLGVVGVVDGKHYIVEYSDLPDEQKYAVDDDGRLVYRMGSIAIHAFRVDFLQRMAERADLPIHQAFKDVPYLAENGQLVVPPKDAKNGVKFEMFIFDVLPLAERVVVFETEREKDFAPVKRAEGEDSPATARQALANLWGSWLEACTGGLPRSRSGDVSVDLEISPLIASDEDELRERLREGAIRLDFNNMMQPNIPAPHGFAEEDLNAMASWAAQAVQAVQARRQAGRAKPFEERQIEDLAWTDLPHERFQVEKIKEAAAAARGDCDNFVVLGIGGSALAITAIVSALLPPYYNELSREQRGGPRIYVLDNVDPLQSKILFDMLDPRRTIFNVISKSGTTAEAISQLLIARDRLRKAGADPSKQIIATTDKDGGALIELAKREGWLRFIVPDGVGGRFSALSPVGLLPAAVVGVDIDALLDGAALMDWRCLSIDLWANPALMNAVLQFLSDQRGKPMSVMMPYAWSLYWTADWFRQLWAESLGKNVERHGKPVNVGPTPVKALGVTDQHSQMQLYMEGPFDKVITFVAVEDFGCECPIPDDVDDIDGVSYLAGHTLNEVMEAERIGAELALKENGRPNCTIYLPRISAHTLGQLFYMLEMQTAYAGEFYNINAFDQPGVELGKLNAHAMLGRKGEKYEKRKIEIEKRPPKDPKFII